MTVQELVHDLTQKSTSGRLSCGQTEKLEQILADYLERLERGETPDTSAIIAEHPAVAEELRENFAKIAALHRAAIGMTDGGETLEQFCVANLDQQRTLGDFRLIQPVGRGGMGVVYEAEQISLKRRVALKTLPLAAVLDPKQLARFKNEAQAAASLDHPHIVSVYAVGSDRGVHFYAMQFIEGLSLAEVVEKLRAGSGEHGAENGGVKEQRSSGVEEQSNSYSTTPLLHYSSPASETRCLASLSTERSRRPADYFRSVARLGIQAAEALHYAHEMGVVHRDVKPSNLLLDNDGQLYVTDFGLAMTQSDSDLTMTGDLLGTLRYMSPEQASGRRALVDRRTDIYSLGASLYELATLQPAFPEEDRARLLQQIVTDPPQTPSKINRDVARDLETIILKAMAKDPSERYETAKTFADDLGRFVKHEPIRARRITRIEHIRSWCRRNKAVASLLAAVSALLLVLSIGGPFAAFKQAQLTRQAQVELNAKTISQLYQDWYSGNVERVGEELKQHSERRDPREFQFEWELLQRLYDDSRKNIFYPNENHDANFSQFVKYSPDGRLIACGQPGGSVAIYDIKRKTFRRLENEPAQGAADVEFSRDGKELITVSRTGVINRRNIATSKVLGPVIDCDVNDELVERAKYYHSIRLTPDGKTAVVAKENGDSAFLVVARLEDGECTRIDAHDGQLNACALSPDSSMLVTSGEDGLIKFWDLNGNQIRPPRPCSYAFDIKFTLDGRKLVICDYVRGVSILDAASLTELPGLRGPQQYVRKLAVYKDEILATAGIDDRIMLWDMKTGNWLTTLVGHEGDILELEFSPDGKSLVSAAADETLRLWQTGRLRDSNDSAATFEWWRTDLQFSADGQKLISCARSNAAPVGVNVDVQLMEWDTVTGESKTIIPPGKYGRSDLAIVPGNEHLGCGGPGEFSVRDRQSGELVRLLDDDPLHEYQHIVVSPDGKWAAGSGHILPRPRQTKYLASRPRGNVGFVFICNLESEWKELFPLPTDSPAWYIRCIEFSPDSKFLVACGGDSVKFSRVDIFECSGDHFHRLPQNVELTQGDARAEAMKVDFSADSRLFGTVDQAGFARIRPLRNPQQQEIIQRKAGLYCLAFSPDGRILALGDSNGIQLCDLQSHFTLAAIPFGRQIRSLEFAPDGRTLAWCTADGKIGWLSTALTTSTEPTTVAPIDTR